MIAGPPKGLIMAAPLFVNKESAMSDVKPVPDVYPANRSIKSCLLGRFALDSYSSPASPKLRELRARYEALHATEKDRNLSPVFGRG